MRGSLSSVVIASARISRIDSLTRRIRAPGISAATITALPRRSQRTWADRQMSAPDVTQTAQVAFNGATLGTAALHEAHQTVRPVRDLAVADEGAEQCRALPLVVPVDLRDRRAEALANRVLQGLDELALPLQVVDFPEMQTNLDQLDERGHEPRLAPARPIPVSSRPAGSRRTRGRRHP